VLAANYHYFSGFDQSVHGNTLSQAERAGCVARDNGSLTIDLRYAPRLFARQVKVDGVRVPRSDRRWVLDVLYERPLRQDVQVRLNYRFEKRNSNDPEKNFNSHLFRVTLSFNWWK